MTEIPQSKPARRRTPAGAWQVVILLALLLIVTPVTVAVPAFPRALAITVAVLFAAVGFGALAWSFVALWRTWGTKAIGGPIIGCVLGAIVVTVVLLVTVPLAFAT